MQKVRVYECWQKKSKDKEGKEVTYHCVRLEDAESNFRYPNYFSFPDKLCREVEKNKIYEVSFVFSYMLVDRVSPDTGEILKGRDQVPVWRISSFNLVKNVA